MGCVNLDSGYAYFPCEIQRCISCEIMMGYVFCILVYNTIQMFEESEWGMPLVHTEATYRRPWRLGERVRIEGRIAEMSERSVQFEYEFKDESGKMRTRVKMRHAFVSLETFQARSAPREFIDAAQRAGLRD